jgi:hypothetical protein
VVGAQRKPLVDMSMGPHPEGMRESDLSHFSLISHPFRMRTQYLISAKCLIKFLIMVISDKENLVFMSNKDRGTK